MDKYLNRVYTVFIENFRQASGINTKYNFPKKFIRSKTKSNGFSWFQSADAVIIITESDPYIPLNRRIKIRLWKNVELLKYGSAFINQKLKGSETMDGFRESINDSITNNEFMDLYVGDLKVRVSLEKSAIVFTIEFSIN